MAIKYIHTNSVGHSTTVRQRTIISFRKQLRPFGLVPTYIRTFGALLLLPIIGAFLLIAACFGKLAETLEPNFEYLLRFANRGHLYFILHPRKYRSQLKEFLDNVKEVSDENTNL